MMMNTVQDFQKAADDMRESIDSPMEYVKERGIDYDAMIGYVDKLNGEISFPQTAFLIGLTLGIWITEHKDA